MLGRVSLVLFISNFSTQHWQVKRKIKCHWGILKQNTILPKILPDNPWVVFRRPQNLRDKPVGNCRFFFPAQQVPTSYVTDALYVGFMGIDTGKLIILFLLRLVNSMILIPGVSSHVVYLFQCSCGVQYMGRTMRHSRDRLREHVYNIKCGFNYHSLSVHFKSAWQKPQGS